MTAKRKAILKLKELVSLGHVPSRGLEEYTHVTTYNEEVAKMVNCFGHAVFNLTNKELEQIKFTEKEGVLFGDIWCDTFIPNEVVEHQLLKMVKNTGLSAVELPDVFKPNERIRLRKNQWRVALYIGYPDSLEKDFHFFLQEKDGSWTSKQGLSNRIDHYSNLPKKYNTYCYYKSYIITNPYAEEKRER